MAGVVGNVERARGVVLEKGELAGVDGAAAQGADLSDDLVRVHAKLDQSEGSEERGETQASEAMDCDGFSEAVETGGGRGARVGVRAPVGVRRGRRAAGSGAGDVVVQVEEVVKQGKPEGDDVGRRGVSVGKRMGIRHITINYSRAEVGDGCDEGRTKTSSTHLLSIKALVIDLSAPRRL